MSGLRSLLAGAGLLAVACTTPATAQIGGVDAQPAGIPDAGSPAPSSTSAAPASRGQVAVQPYVEVGQVLLADLKGGDTVTYSYLAAGVDAAAATARTQAQISYRYERRIPWNDDFGDSDVHTGLARVAALVAPGLSVEAGALATRTRSNIGGAAPGLLSGDNDNVSQLYAVYAGPSYANSFGALNVGADYRIGYTKVEVPGAGGLTPGQPRLDNYDRSIGHLVTARVGTSPGTVLPVGLTLSGGYVREDANQLDQRFEDGYGRLDALLPVSPYLALQGGIGYEKLTSSSRAPLFTQDGQPVVDGNGRFVTDKSAPRRVDYRTDGVYFDAGVVWRPNRRTSVSAAVGRRYDSTYYVGQATWAASPSVGVAVNVYDSVETFGHQLRDSLGSLPTSFITARDQYSQQFNGCVFGTTGAAPGACLNRVLQSISTATYRTRGVEGIVSATRGLTSYGLGVGYVNRKLYSRYTPGVSLYGLEDESYYAQAFFGRRLSPVSSVDANIFVNYYDPASRLAEGVWSYGATGSYNHAFGRVSTIASVGIYSFQIGDFDSELSAQVLLAARYTF
ncbi:hypothetical protein SAMN05192583_0187 [Sphingomonas gellani]|uniref:Preprotein translocase subunit YajC n=1 Tax=Sphingomonas gellani TaxID=1166340 RepID=A0A1H7YAQ7_9SPHN|nr:hypothetical protein [Sphingomonas gellani]SEM43272.1 hypothetical protein SAMN05192583_0187 [Sphingomonas gellani]